jgi:hypothetical protein
VGARSLVGNPRAIRGGTHYALVEASAGDFLLLADADGSVAQMPHETLLETYGPLTMLELLLALAPEQQPSERLVDAHFAEVDLMGRDDSSVRQVEYTPPIVEKAWSEGTCRSQSHNVLKSNFPGIAHLYSYANTMVAYGSLWTDLTLLAETITVCNPNDYSFPIRFGWWYQSTGWQYFNQMELGANQYAAVYGNVTTNPRRHSVEWEDVQTNDVMYVVNATGYYD